MPLSSASICFIAWFVAVFSGALLRAQTKRIPLRLIRGAAIALACFFWLAMSGAMVSDAFLQYHPPELVQVVWGTSMFLSVDLALLLGLIFRGLWTIERQKQRSTRETLGESVRLAMSCPWCEAPSTFQTGTARCGACGMRMMIRLEEPRCECGYLIYQLQGDSCPECGKPIAPPPPPFPRSHRMKFGPQRI